MDSDTFPWKSKVNYLAYILELVDTIAARRAQLGLHYDKHTESNVQLAIQQLHRAYDYVGIGNSVPSSLADMAEFLIDYHYYAYEPDFSSYDDDSDEYWEEFETVPAPAVRTKAIRRGRARVRNAPYRREKVSFLPRPEQYWLGVDSTLWIATAVGLFAAAYTDQFQFAGYHTVSVTDLKAALDPSYAERVHLKHRMLDACGPGPYDPDLIPAFFALWTVDLWTEAYALCS